MSPNTGIEYGPTPSEAIVDRWLAMQGQRDAIVVVMDLSAANGVNGNPPLDLDRLEAFDHLNFAHDMAGIGRNINRRTGKIENNFVPRCAIHKATR